MLNLKAYSIAFLGAWSILLLMTVQWGVASLVKALQPGAISGKFDSSLSHTSFVFRSHRTFQNSLENMPLFLGAFFLAVFIGVSILWVTVTVWVFFIARFLHMVCYYCIATQCNPSIRTWFFLCGVVSNVVLLVVTGIALVG